MPYGGENKNSCQWQASAASYLQGELWGEELIQFEAHLSRCLFCQGEVFELQQLIQQMQNMPQDLPHRDLTPRIIEKIPPHAWRRSTSIAKVVACILLAIAGSWLIVHLLGRRSQQVLPHKSEVIAKALDWLIRAQEPSGAWDATKWGGQRDYTVGLTALALLAFLGDEAPFRAPYTQTIDRALRYIVRQQSSKGRLGPVCRGTMYNHGIATVALLETYTLTKDIKLRGPITRAIEYICARQTPSGGWGYIKGPIGSENTSISIWQLHALLLANKLGWKDTKGNIQKGLFWLRVMVDEKGHVGYRGPGDFPYGSKTLTAMGTFYLIATGYKGINPERCMIRFKQCLRKIASKHKERLNFYHCYFVTYAIQAMEMMDCHLMGNLLRPLVEHQIKVGVYSGSWDPSDRWGLTGGRIYSTAMAILSLQADHRAPRIINWIKGVY